MNPLLLLLLGFGGGALAASVYDKSKANAAAAEASRQNVLGMAVTSLTQGSKYGVMIMVDPRDPSWGRANTLPTATAQIQQAMTQFGWQLLNTLTLSDPSQANAFFAGTPAQWTFTGAWTLAQPFMQSKPGWLTQLLAYPVPG